MPERDSYRVMVSGVMVSGVMVFKILKAERTAFAAIISR